MPSYQPVIKNGGAIFYLSLLDTAATGSFKVNPTIAAGDFKVSIDGAAFANLTTLPTVTPAGGSQVKFTLSAAETNGDNVSVQCVDQTAPKEWVDAFVRIQTAAGSFDTLQADTDNIQTRLPAALVAGRMDSSVGAVAASAITAAAIATDAIGSAQLAATAVTEIQTGLATAAAVAALPTVASITALQADTDDIQVRLTTAQTDIDNIQTRLPAALTGGRMDSSAGAMSAGVISSAVFAAGAINAAAIAADAIGSSQLAATATAEIADAIWDEILSGHVVAGSAGAALASAGVSSDPWATALPGAYGAGSAGNIIGSRVDAAVSTRASAAQVTTVGTDVSAIRVKTDANLDVTVSSRLAPTTLGRTLDVSATGEAGLDWANIGSPATAVSLTSTVISVNQQVASVSGAVGSVTGGVGGNVGGSVGSIGVNGISLSSFQANSITASALATDAVTEIQTGLAQHTTLLSVSSRLPAGLVGGRMDSSVGAMAADVVNASALATDAVTEIQTGLVTAGSMAVAQADLDNIQTRLPATLVGGRMDSTVGAVIPGAITSAGFAADAINANALAADAVTEIQVGLLKPTVAGRTLDVSVTGEAGIDWGNIGNATATVFFSNTIVNGVNWVGEVAVLSAGAIDNVAMGTDAISASALSAGAVAEIADGVLDELLAGHVTVGTFGLAINDLEARRVLTTNLAYTVPAIGRGTVWTDSTIAVITTGVFDPNTGAADQFVGRVVLFDADTTTVALRGCARAIIASTNGGATPIFTVEALTAAPVMGDKFSVI